MQTSILTKEKYQQRVLAWAADRKFLWLSSPWIPDNPPACDACGSKRVTKFILLECEGKYFLVGWECMKSLDITMSPLKHQEIDIIEKKVLEERCELAKEKEHIPDAVLPEV